MNRLARWIRGDWQITRWLKKSSPLNLLSKYKIFDNLRRSLFEISTIIAFIYLNIIGILYKKTIYPNILLLSIIVIFPFILEMINKIMFKKEGEQKQKTFTPKITGIQGALYRLVITLACLPYKAYISLKSIVKTIYRMLISKVHLLEWTTSEEAEKQAKTSLASYYNQMSINFLSGIISISLGLLKNNIFAGILGILWISAPLIMWYIRKRKKSHRKIKQKRTRICIRNRKKNMAIF